ncbi:unnamed protein product [Adineta steineri]|uniref:Ankyrin repeat protein n=1 Tax=Adineta steineri TaxID=433720 RepID=A0A818T9H0_9BILA|nr:unnamed protein product [Adineta steineri]
MESLQSTTVDLHVQSPSQISTYPKLESPGEYGMWPLINYDRSEAKSTQELLFEAASEKDPDMARQKWELFKRAVENESLSKNKVMQMIGTLDEDKQWAALHYAVDSNNEELCRRLTFKLDKYQCDVNILGGNGENVLHVVSQSKYIWQGTGDVTTAKVPDLVRLLVEERHADVNHADDEGRTPLHMAAMRGRLPYMDYLIANGAKVDVAAHPAITRLSSIDQKEGQQDSKKKLMELFTRRTTDKTQIPVVFDMIARRKQHQQFNHLENLFEKASPQTQEQIIRLACRYDNRPNWREMMRNAQPIEATDAYDTPMRKLIRYMPDVALWTVEEKLTRKVGGAGQKVSKEIYDYEFYEDMNAVKQWYAQGLAVGEIPTLMEEGTLWRDKMLYNFVSDGEILRLQFLRLMRFLSCYQLTRIPCMIPRPIIMLTYDERAHGWFEKAWHYTMKHFFEEKIQDDVELKIPSKKEAKEHQEEKEN